MKTSSSQSIFAFKWKYVILPWIFLALSVVLIWVYYSRLPFQVAWHFKSDGSGDGFVIKPLIIFWTLLPQVLLTLGATLITWIFTFMANRYLEAEHVLVDPRRIFMLIGNMVAIPQLIIVFAMLDIFRYNSNQSHLQPSVLIFALIVMVAGGIVLGVLLMQVMQHVYRGGKKVNPKSDTLNPKS